MNTFYKLTPEDIMEMNSLRNSEMRVLLYLRSTTPFGDRPINMSIREIAKNLEMHPSTVSRALKELDHLGWISMELLAVSVTVNPFSPSKDVLRPRNSYCAHATAIAPTQQLLRPRNTCSSNPSPSKDSSTPKTNKTNKTSKKRERGEILKFLESNQGFREFCVRKAMELPDRPVLVESWINSNIQELESLYKSKSSPVDKSSVAGCENFPEVEILFPKVSAAIALGELKQDPVFPDGVFDLEGNWYKKTDWEAMQNDHNN